MSEFRKVFDAADAVRSLRPTSGFFAYGPTHSDIVWDPNNTETFPTLLEISTEQARLQKEYDDSLYLTYRKKEYPPIEHYLDGVVKNDNTQIAEFKAAWDTVNNKYPAPGGQ